MKKFLALLAAMLVIAVMFTGCSAEIVVINSVAELESKIIGVQLGTTGDIYAEDIKDATIERYKTGADAVQALKHGKINAVIIDNEPAKEFVNKNPELMILSEEFALEDYAIAVKKGNTELTNAINGALAELKADGTLAQIAANWIGEAAGSCPYITPKGTEYPNGKLVMATNAQFPPYELSEEGKVVGFDVDMMRAVCDKLGYELVIEDMAFDSIIAAVDSGKADVGVAGMTVTEDRLKNIDFTDSYTTAMQVVIVRNPDAPVDVIGNIGDALYENFIAGNRWMYLVKGLGVTLLITFFALIMGLVLGFVVAIVRSTHDKTGRMKIANVICKIYLTVIRGTPVVVQLLIIYFVIFGSVNIDKTIVAVLAFGLNSGAYVAEIVRGGIMSIDNGQFEAGSSLGLSYRQTMISIIMPQAFKNVLPALANEFIVLLKETSVAGYIAIEDLTKGGDIIRSQTYEAFLPLIAVALIYLGIVMLLTHLVGKLERRLAKNDKR